MKNIREINSSPADHSVCAAFVLISILISNKHTESYTNLHHGKHDPVLFKAEISLYKRLNLKQPADWKENANNWMKMYKFSVSLLNSIKMYGDK